ncbi:biotin-[acetyl-CoA-carboxylase] ligase [Cryptosporidium felis]|nr:biotin-[acetyl-CoA-carboxylase] ligase [Cryptosporidium felis]
MEMKENIYKKHKHSTLPLNVFHFHSLPSTQTWAYENVDFLVNSGNLSPNIWVVITADVMTSGIGSYDSKLNSSRNWYSLEGKSICATYIILKRKIEQTEPEICIRETGTYTLGAAFIACIVLESFGIKSPGIKWVNDVYINNRKVGGILCKKIDKVYLFEETEYEPMVLGIGLNVLHDEVDLPENLDTPATSIKIESELETSQLSINGILEKLHLEMIKNVTRFSLSTNLEFQESIFREINRKLIYKGKRIRIEDYEIEGTEIKMGIFQGIDKNGYALIRCPEKNEENFKLSHGRIEFIG